METTYALNENKTLQEIKRPPRIGFIKTFAGTTPPEGTLLCDGSAVSREAYEELFAVIGTMYGAGDGETTFNLPDLRDQWILCAGTEHEAGDSVAEGLPEIAGSFATCQINSSHAVVFDVTGAYSQTSKSSGGTANAAAMAGTLVYFTHFNASLYNPIYGAQSHVTPASVAVLPCIVYE